MTADTHFTLWVRFTVALLQNGSTALMLAVQYGHGAVIQELLNSVPVQVVTGASGAAVQARKRTDINTHDKVPLTVSINNFYHML